MSDKINRKIAWLSSVSNKDSTQIICLEKRLAAFYESSPNYYSAIDFTSKNWIDNKEPGYRDIVALIKDKQNILEVGCGSANILKYYPFLEKQYCGCDFSADLVEKNSKKYNAEFKCINLPNTLPYEGLKFDVVFSVFVLEHSANPSMLLKECVRVLKDNGLLIILCPDFLGRGRMTSQRAGLSRGTTRDKLKQKKYLDALITFFDNKIKIPAYCNYFSFISRKSPGFYINIHPTVFCDEFIPDADAVYLTFKPEIILFLKHSLRVLKNSAELFQYERKRKLIYLKLVKMKS